MALLPRRQHVRSEFDPARQADRVPQGDLQGGRGHRRPPAPLLRGRGEIRRGRPHCDRRAHARAGPEVLPRVGAAQGAVQQDHRHDGQGRPAEDPRLLREPTPPHRLLRHPRRTLCGHVGRRSGLPQEDRRALHGDALRAQRAE